MNTMKLATRPKLWPFRQAGRIPLDSCFLSPKNLATAQALYDFALAEAELGSGIATHAEFNNKKIQWETKVLMGQLLRFEPSDISFKENTNAGVAQIALGFPFKVGDEVITYRYDYSSVFEPLKAIKNINVIYLEGVKDENETPIRWDLAEIEKKITTRTRLIVISHVQFISGYKADLEALSSLCRKNNIRLVIDIAQSVGVLPVYPSELKLDAVVFPCWKGLLAPRGLGVLWTTPEFRGEIGLAIRGSSALQMKSFTDWNAPEFTDGRKFEPSTLPTNLIYGLKISLLTNFIQNGIDAVAAKIKQLQKRFLSNINQDFFVPIFSDSNDLGLILSFSLPQHSKFIFNIVEEAQKRGIVLTARGGLLRAAPHYFLDEADIDRATAELNSIAGNIAC